MSIKAIALSVGAFTALGASLFAAHKIGSIQNHYTTLSIPLNQIYATLDKDSYNLALNGSDLNDIAHMGGVIALKDHQVAIGGICSLPILEPSHFKSITVDITLIQGESGSVTNGQPKNTYQALIKVQGSEKALNIPAAEFSLSVSRSIRSTFDALRECHIQKANTSTISDLIS